jgi:glutamine amidotransferase-like uncharacterized protein
MRMALLLISFVLLSNIAISKEIWIYSDNGTWIDGIIAFEQFLEHIGESGKRVYADDLNNLDDFSDAKAICFPGGYAYDYKIALSGRTINNLRNYVASGGAYIGICAGAFFASSSVVWEGIEYPYTLGLFEGKAIGSIHEIAPWDNYQMTSIAINASNPVSGSTNNDLSVLYYGGPYFESNSTEYDTVALWSNYFDKTAIINFTYQNGKVLLIGPHLEIETNSNRDSTNFADGLDDVESDWPLLESLMGWLLKPNTSSYRLENYTIDPAIYPNPASDIINVRANGGSPIKIFNSYGECVMTTLIHPMTRSHRMNIEHLPVGIYFLQIGNYSEKFAVVR